LETTGTQINHRNRFSGGCDITLALSEKFFSIMPDFLNPVVAHIFRGGFRIAAASAGQSLVGPESRL
jgi:hypothetical protein